MARLIDCEARRLERDALFRALLRLLDAELLERAQARREGADRIEGLRRIQDPRRSGGLRRLLDGGLACAVGPGKVHFFRGKGKIV